MSENVTEKTYSFEELLDMNGRFIWRTSGRSMMPLIRQGKDAVVISKPEGRLKKYDVALYKIKDKYLLHRVLKVCDGYYIIAGDNNTFLEKIPDEKIIGVMTELNRGGNKCDLNGKKYRFYAKAWCGNFRLKSFIIKAWRAVYGFAWKACEKIKNALSGKKA